METHWPFGGDSPFPLWLAFVGGGVQLVAGAVVAVVAIRADRKAAREHEERLRAQWGRGPWDRPPHG